jgi:diguanylate cyclase (GGDEF)-like protein
MSQENEALLARLTHVSTTDALTGVANRRHGEALLDKEIRRARRYRTPLALLTFDIDRFKAINDGYGHAAGDEFLKLLARTARAHLRGQDLLARLGGDEFSVLMPETSGENATKSANRLVAAIREVTLSRDGATVGSTISVGVAEWSPAVGNDPCVLLELADRALYLTKNGGRDGVTVAPSSPVQVGEPLAA